MTDQYIVLKYVFGYELEHKEVVCIVDDFELAMSITEYLNENDDPVKDGNGNDVYIEYWVTSKKHVTSLDGFIKWWEDHSDVSK